MQNQRNHNRVPIFRSIHWRFIILVSLAVILGVLCTVFWTTAKIRQEANLAALEKVRGDLLMGETLLDSRYPGPWSVRDGMLYKGDVRMSGNEEVVDMIGRLTGDTCTIFMGDTRVATNVIRDERRATGTKVSDDVARAVLIEGREFYGEAEVVGVKYQTAYKPIRDGDGRIVGMWYVGADKQFVDNMVRDSIREASVAFVVVMLVVIGVIYLLADSLTRPINKLIGAANRLARGDLETEIEVGAGDEIGHLARTFDRMRVRLGRQYLDLQKSNMLLRESERRFRELLESVRLLAVILDTEGRIIFCNDHFLRVAGWEREAVLGRKWAETFVAPERYDYVSKILRDVAHGIVPTDRDSFIVTRGGEPRLIAWNNSLYRDLRGDIAGLARIGEDVTEQRMEEEDLRAAHQQLVDIIEFLPDATFAVDNDQKVIAWNRAMEELTGVKKEDIIGRGDRAYAVPLYGFPRSVMLDVIFCIGNKNSNRNHYEQIERRDNKFFTEVYKPSVYNGKGAFLWVTAAPLFDSNGYLAGAIETMRDVTARKQMEKQMACLDRLELIGEMAAGIAHEIRNPMASVRGFLQLFTEKEDLKGYREHLKLMIEELDRGNAIISEYLSLAKGKKVDLRERDLNAVIRSLLPLLRADAARHDKCVRTELGDIPPLLLDEGEMRQLIVNLSRNGLEAMEFGPGENLTIRTTAEGETVVLAVGDEGSGIAPEHLAKLGTPFFTTKDHGTGLGLAVCYSIAARHNATIAVETGFAGTVFKVHFKPSGVCILSPGAWYNGERAHG